jgi:hypothetical protein
MHRRPSPPHIAGNVRGSGTSHRRQRLELHGQVAERERIQQLAPETRLVLANAIYLKAAWETPFVVGETRDRI